MPRGTANPQERAKLHAHLRRALDAKPPRQMVLVQRRALEQLMAENMALAARLAQAGVDLREADEALTAAAEKLGEDAPLILGPDE